jgi:hypothetical protein
MNKYGFGTGSSDIKFIIHFVKIGNVIKKAEMGNTHKLAW